MRMDIVTAIKGVILIERFALGYVPTERFPYRQSQIKAVVKNGVTEIASEKRKRFIIYHAFPVWEIMGEIDIED